MLKVFWVSCGDKDGLLSISQGVLQYLKQEGCSHIWNVDSESHIFPIWKNDLYWFAQQFFPQK